MKLVTYVTAGTNIKNNLKCIEIEYNDGTIDYFTLEIDPATNRRKNFRTKGGKLFARTTKSFKKISDLVRVLITHVLFTLQ